MDTILWLAVAYAVAFVINVIPAFMPPTWAVLAFFYVHYELPLLVLTVGGAACSTLGRTVLAWASSRWGRKIVPAKRLGEVDALGKWLDSRPSWQVPLAVLVFSIGPIPSNSLFIAAGLARTRLRPVALGFFAGRVISYTAAAVTTSKVSGSLESILRNYWSSSSSLLVQVASLVLIVGFTLIPWSKIFHISIPTETTASTQASSTADESASAHHRAATDERTPTSLHKAG